MTIWPDDSLQNIHISLAFGLTAHGNHQQTAAFRHPFH